MHSSIGYRLNFAFEFVRILCHLILAIAVPLLYDFNGISTAKKHHYVHHK